ncbi:ABC transporter permease [archaeon]|jgi:ABC-type polysaccharide/polyol phosphate export permease|nr:ABC transporter permease [Candidatus Woesearchaeota archaeon]MBT3464023.1 ABC transporter permease [archaeon]MBT4351699.1 ABC transporter permease [archaeon]MBT4647521.1 ABC transporter permease [archaeon]MBT6821982.1 ABC transporter permease [archaeon]
MKIREQANLILELAIKDIKLKYSNSAFGYFWMFVNPLLLIITLYVIFSWIMDLEMQNYQIFLLLGIIVWNFFSQATTNCVNSVSSGINLLKKIKIPLYTLILGSNLSSLISFVISLIILIIMMLLSKIDIFTPIRILSLFYFFILFIFIFGISILISVMYIHFKDTSHIWEFFLLIGFWMTPIVYSETFIPNKYLKYYMLNPLARIISHLRNTMIYNYIDSLEQIIITVIIVFIMFLTSILIYYLYSKKIYDLV